MAELSPPILHEHGLSAGLKWLVEQMKTHGLTMTIKADDAADLFLPEDTALLLFQSVRELLVNVLKHADSHEVKRSEGILPSRCVTMEWASILPAP
jgi:signal transduction histidine kinase